MKLEEIVQNNTNTGNRYPDSPHIVEVTKDARPSMGYHVLEPEKGGERIHIFCTLLITTLQSVIVVMRPKPV
jgi:hypothetical protein